MNLPQDTTLVRPLEEDENNVFKPDLLIASLEKNRFNRKYFQSVLQRYVIPMKIKGQSQNDYNKSKS